MFNILSMLSVTLMKASSNRRRPLCNVICTPLTHSQYSVVDVGTSSWANSMVSSNCEGTLTAMNSERCEHSQPNSPP
eukprot:3577825-Prymnesium_polylepis.1